MWQASHIYAEPSVELMAELSRSAVFGPGLYLVRDLAAFPWYRAAHRRALPAPGLAVVREVAFEDRDDPAGGPVIPGDAVAAPGGPEIIEPTEVINSGLLQGEVALPPGEFLRYLKALHCQTGSAVAYYYHLTWSGQTELEYAWVFSRQEEALLSDRDSSAYRFTAEGGEPFSGSILRRTLGTFGLELPSPFFALHDRGFDWERWRVEHRHT